jgi:outer membrane protein assembly factor BamE (lipoprotein component of BamABCDE complex)
MLGGCFTQTYQRGYVLADGALEQIPLGAPQEQVLISLGTPSTVATVSGEVFYYISARTEQTSFLPRRWSTSASSRSISTRTGRVERIANYGLPGRQDLRLTSAARRRPADRNSPTSPTCSRFSAASSRAMD